jgi:hypothetical protein
LRIFQLMPCVFQLIFIWHNFEFIIVQCLVLPYLRNGCCENLRQEVADSRQLPWLAVQPKLKQAIDPWSLQNQLSSAAKNVGRSPVAGSVIYPTRSCCS